ncbi:MAG TPA: fused MFS/spermidine synthase [Planctomycetota bacterium]
MLLLLAFASGAAALTYEAVWIRWFRLLFGSTTHASSATLAAFFGGLALGAALAGRRASRVARPLRAYAWIELAAAAAALWVPLAVWLYDPLYPALYARLGDERWAFIALKLALAALAVLPASVLLGAALPFLATALLGSHGSLGRDGSRLYALNTLGAAAGAVLGALLGPEWIGLPATYGAALATSTAIALASFALAPTGTSTPGRAPEMPASATGPRPDAGATWLAFASGFGVLAFEVLLIHALGQLYSHSAYTLGLVLLAVLLALAAGAALVSASAGRVTSATLLRLGLALTAALVLATPWIVRGLGPPALVAGFAAFLCAGVVFPLTFRLASAGPAGARLGRLLAANTLGGILGSLGASFLLLPWLGLWSSIGWLGVLYASAALVVPGTARARAATLALPALAALGLALAGRDPWHTPSVTLRAGERLLALREGAHGLVSVVESADGNRRIKIDDVYQFGDSREVRLSERTGHLPLLLHPDPRTVAFVGSATGGVAGAAVLHPVERIDLIEIVPEVQELAAAHFAPFNRGVHADPRAQLVTEDGRNHLRATRTHYDVIVEDCFVPYTPGAASMYTREHYHDVRARLTERGIFCQWLPVYQLEGEMLAIVLATFLAEFPEGTLWRPHLRPHFPVVGLIGGNGRLPGVAEIERRAGELAALGVDDPWVTDARALWLMYLGPAAAAFTGPLPRPHRDAQPYYEFVAARISPADLGSFRYADWIHLSARVVAGAGARELFPGRPGGHPLGACALQRANLAWAGGVKDRAAEAWREASRHLPEEILALRDMTFSDVWPR